MGPSLKSEVRQRAIRTIDKRSLRGMQGSEVACSPGFYLHAGYLSHREGQGQAPVSENG